VSTGLRGEDPFVQLTTTDAEWIGLVLVGARTKAIKGDAK
jgi:hypothetical protein